MVDLEGNSKPIEEIQVGEMVLARNEFDPLGPLELKQVEELFTNSSPLIELEIGGQKIGTTEEHPFYVPAREAFVPARELQVGDQLVSHDGQLLRIDAIHSTLQIATVYNLRVADYHTYFVGCNEWGWSVWAHNACVIEGKLRELHLSRDAEGLTPKWRSAIDLEIARLEAQRTAKQSVAANLEFVHNVKPHKLTDMAELNDQVGRQVARMNEIIETEGLQGLKNRIRAYNAATEADGRAYVKKLPKADNGMAWLHEPDMRTGGLPSDVRRQGSKRINSIIGGNSRRIAQDILNLPDNINHFNFTLKLQ